ncbi:DUF6461 domain-containing protein [Streptomyces sp. NPDC005349]|uniref:DUF6461 domain-containing protein n=1 Tax=Streptomyces sp. NPDC005349 TaxID=3157037 RepID=UPI0033A63143
MKDRSLLQGVLQELIASGPPSAVVGGSAALLGFGQGRASVVAVRGIERDAGGDDLFEDQVLRLCFDPVFPEDRWGTAPDELLDVMQRIGFHLKEDPPETDLSSPAAFALAEHLTGVAITPPLLQDTAFACATIQIR